MSKLSRLNWCHSIDAKFYPKNLFDSFREMISIYLEKNSSKNEGKNIDKKKQKKNCPTSPKKFKFWEIFRTFHLLSHLIRCFSELMFQFLQTVTWPRFEICKSKYSFNGPNAQEELNHYFMPLCFVLIISPFPYSTAVNFKPHSE